jgi:hypothetical protein
MYDDESYTSRSSGGDGITNLAVGSIDKSIAEVRAQPGDVFVQDINPQIIDTPSYY